MLIKYLPRTKINIEKYNACIDNSINSRIYAYSWYLDIVTDDWDVLILDDYTVVMPLPKRKKYGLNYIYLPAWAQQLGIFSEIEIDENLIFHFISKIPKKFVLVDYFFNSFNEFNHKKLEKRDNFILRLNTDYELLRKNFSKNRKRRINQARKANLRIAETEDLQNLIHLFKINKGAELGDSKFDFKILNKLIYNLRDQKSAKILEIKNEKNDLIGGVVFLYDNNRITYLFSAINAEGRNKQAMSYLIDHVIEQNSNSNLIFDFEGSLIPEIASFYKSFGAVLETYYHFKQKRLKLI